MCVTVSTCAMVDMWGQRAMWQSVLSSHHVDTGVEVRLSGWKEESTLNGLSYLTVPGALAYFTVILRVSTLPLFQLAGGGGGSQFKGSLGTERPGFLPVSQQLPFPPPKPVKAFQQKTVSNSLGRQKL